jgi:hypothetical protein
MVAASVLTGHAANGTARFQLRRPEAFRNLSRIDVSKAPAPERTVTFTHHWAL